MNKFTAAEHITFHEQISKIIRDAKVPSQVLDGIYEYIDDEGLNHDKALSMILVSSMLVVHKTLLTFYEELSQFNNKMDDLKIDFIEVFNAQLINLLWHYSVKDIKVVIKGETYEDAPFVNYIKNSITDIVSVISKWISAWFYSMSMKQFSVEHLISLIDLIFAEMNYSIEMLIYSYYYVLHDLINLKKITFESVAQINAINALVASQKDFNLSQPQSQTSKDSEEHSFEFDGKTFTINNKNPH